MPFLKLWVVLTVISVVPTVIFVLGLNWLRGHDRTSDMGQATGLAIDLAIMAMAAIWFTGTILIIIGANLPGAQ